MEKSCCVFVEGTRMAVITSRLNFLFDEKCVHIEISNFDCILGIAEMSSKALEEIHVKLIGYLSLRSPFNHIEKDCNIKECESYRIRLLIQQQPNISVCSLHVYVKHSQKSNTFTSAPLGLKQSHLFSIAPSV